MDNMEEMTSDFDESTLFGIDSKTSDDNPDCAKESTTAPEIDVVATEPELVPVNPNVTETVVAPTPSPEAPKSSSIHFDDDLPNLIGEDVPEEYKEIYLSFRQQYAMLPVLNYKEIYSELGDLSIESTPSPTMQVINDEIQKIQGCKDRLSQIYNDVCQNFYFKKRAVDVLEKSWAKYTHEKNSEKRKGDAAAKVSLFYEDFARTEACFHVCQHILKNLDSNHESLSRRIMVNGQLLKMNDYGRGGGIPERDYNSPSSGSQSEFVSELETESPDNNGSEEKGKKDEFAEEHF
jgi:hypothetical protein